MRCISQHGEVEVMERLSTSLFELQAWLEWIASSPMLRTLSHLCFRKVSRQPSGGVALVAEIEAAEAEECFDEVVRWRIETSSRPTFRLGVNQKSWNKTNSSPLHLLFSTSSILIMSGRDTCQPY